MTFLIYSQLSAEVRISLAMLSMVISVITLNITTLGTKFTLMALGGILTLHLILFKLKKQEQLYWFRKIINPYAQDKEYQITKIY